MVLTITQENFDNTVRENMNEFEMAIEEAVKETIEQYTAQGVDLSNIVTDWMMAGAVNSPLLVEAIAALDRLEGTSGQGQEQLFIAELVKIRAECGKGLNYQILAGKEGAYNVIMKVLYKFDYDVEVIKECLQTLVSLMTKHPDLLDEDGVRMIIKLVDNQKDEGVLRLVLKWTKECCTLHELNRQKIFEADILEHLKLLLQKQITSALLRDVLAVLRALCLDDDVRVEFGRAHEHARVIASDTLCAIIGLLEKFKQDSGVMIDLLLTVSALLVRTEFCKKVDDAGGIQIVQEAMNQFKTNDKIVKQCLKVLKALAGNDECKAHIVQKGLGPDILSVMDQHQKNAQAATFGLACIAALTLRSPDNSKSLFEAGAADVIVRVLQLHPDNENVQKNGSWAIRNMVSRSRYQCKKFLDLGVEEVLKASMKKFKKCEYDIKAALRDLGCDVELKEEWTGKGGKITTQGKK